MSKELKELLKPPFTNASTNVLNGDMVTIFSISRIAAYPDVFYFLRDALQNQWERDFGEPMRWIKSRSLGIDWIDCPHCKHGLQEGTKDLNYCPFCGLRLLPPEEE